MVSPSENQNAATNAVSNEKRLQYIIINIFHDQTKEIFSR